MGDDKMDDFLDQNRAISNALRKVVINQKFCQVLAQRVDAVINDMKDIKLSDLKAVQLNRARKVFDDALELIQSCTTNTWLKFVCGPSASERFGELKEKLQNLVSDLKLSTSDYTFSLKQDEDAEAAARTALEDELKNFGANIEDGVLKVLIENYRAELPAIRSKLLQLGKKSSLTSSESKMKTVLEKIVDVINSDNYKLEPKGSRVAAQPVVVNTPPPVREAPAVSTITVSGVSYEEVKWEEIEIITQVGVGAFAEVFEGLRHGERVAVKKLISQDNDKAIKELEYEVNLMASFHSGYCVTLYGACFKKPNMCMVMEYLPGGSLNHLLYDITVDITWEKRWGYARDAALGMNYLHSRNPAILHRDLKSGNLLLSADGRVKVTDFGLSKLKDSVVEGEDNFQGGTDRWTAPEIGDGEKYTEAADVFSYGVILYEIAARKLPFQDVPAENVRALWKKGERPPIPDDTPPDFEKLIKMCWSQLPRSRPSFADIIQYLRKKGKITTISTEKSQGRISDEKEKLERENAILTQLKENLEKKRDEAERIAEREKKRRVELELQAEDAESKLKDEKTRRAQLEKENLELQKNLRAESDKLKQIEDAKKDSEKKAQKLRKKAEAEGKEELMKAAEEADKRIADERAKVARLREQIDTLEKRVGDEEARRLELEKKLKLVTAEVDEQKKKTDDAIREKEQVEKKLNSEKKKVALEKKRREELELELEEEQKKSRKLRAAART